MGQASNASSPLTPGSPVTDFPFKPNTQLPEVSPVVSNVTCANKTLGVIVGRLAVVVGAMET